MSEPPRVDLTAGRPTADEEEAARAAILRIWGDDRSRTHRAAGLARWTLAGRAAATGNGIEDLRTTAAPGAAWRLSLRVAGHGLVAPRRTGRGDSR